MKIRWRHPLIVVAVIGGVFGLANEVAKGSIGALIAYVASTREAGSRPAANTCSEAETHFRGTESVRDPNRQRDALVEHRALFPACRFASLAQLRIQDIEAQRSASSAPLSSRDPPAATVEPGAPPIQLPQITVYGSPPPASDARVGDVYGLAGGVHYRVFPTPLATTTYRVARGAVAVIMDGVDQGTSGQGMTFRLYTRGNASKFALHAWEDSQVVVESIIEGDHIRRRAAFLAAVAN